MEYVVEILTNNVVKERHKFTNKHEAMSMYLELDTLRGIEYYGGEDD